MNAPDELAKRLGDELVPFKVWNTLSDHANFNVAAERWCQKQGIDDIQSGHDKVMLWASVMLHEIAKLQVTEKNIGR